MTLKEKEQKVIMLPTEDNNCPIVKNSSHSRLLPRVNYDNEPSVGQHLYITTDEKINEGDYAMSTRGFGVFRVGISLGKAELEMHTVNPYITDIAPYTHTKSSNDYRQYLRKIIATTDSKLTIHTIEELGLEASVDKYTKIPQPSQAFIEKYCKVGGIDEIEVEYKYYTDMTTSILDNILQVKVDKSNIITIHPIKDSWTGIELFGNQEGGLDQFLMNSTKYSQGDREMILDAIHNWITNNI